MPTASPELRKSETKLVRQAGDTALGRLDEDGLFRLLGKLHRMRANRAAQYRRRGERVLATNNDDPKKVTRLAEARAALATFEDRISAVSGQLALAADESYAILRASVSDAVDGGKKGATKKAAAKTTATAKKATAKKATAKKVTAKKATAKKAPARKTVRKKAAS